MHCRGAFVTLLILYCYLLRIRLVGEVGGRFINVKYVSEVK